MKDVFYIFLVLLVLLVIISTLGGSIRQKEKFYQATELKMPEPSPDLAHLLANHKAKGDQQPGENIDSLKNILSNTKNIVQNFQDTMPPVTTMGSSDMVSAMFNDQKNENETVEGFDDITSYAAY